MLCIAILKTHTSRTVSSWGEIKTMPMAELIKIDPDLTNEVMDLIY